MSRIRYVLQNDSVVGKNTSVPRMVFISWRFRGRCQHWNLSPFMAAVGKLISCGWNRSCCLFWSDPWMKNGSYILTSFPCFKESIIFSDMPLCWLAAVLMLRSLGRLDSRHGSFPQAQRPAKLKIFTLWLCELADAWCIRLAQRTVGFDILSRREQGGGGGDVVGVLGRDLRRDGKAFTGAKSEIRTGSWRCRKPKRLQGEMRVEGGLRGLTGIRQVSETKGPHSRRTCLSQVREEGKAARTVGCFGWDATPPPPAPEHKRTEPGCHENAS